MDSLWNDFAFWCNNCWRTSNQTNVTLSVPSVKSIGIDWWRLTYVKARSIVKPYELCYFNFRGVRTVFKIQPTIYITIILRVYQKLELRAQRDSRENLQKKDWKTNEKLVYSILASWTLRDWWQARELSLSLGEQKHKREIYIFTLILTMIE